MTCLYLYATIYSRAFFTRGYVTSNQSVQPSKPQPPPFPNGWRGVLQIIEHPLSHSQDPSGRLVDGCLTVSCWDHLWKVLEVGGVAFSCVEFFHIFSRSLGAETYHLVWVYVIYGPYRK